MATTEGYNDLHSKPRRKRAPHNKVKTGCITCKIRRLRCDEQKPQCNRCVSTGRKCDGYAAKIAAPDPQGGNKPLGTGNYSNSSASNRPIGLYDRRRDLALALPRMNEQELRSYHHFISVAAPSFAGVFDADFWLEEIPRACHADPAIWHAVVSLGAIHESYLAAAGSVSAVQSPESSHTTFALQQFNSSIRQLIEPPSLKHDKWRALTASVLYICVCSLQGLHNQALFHLKSCLKLLKEVLKEKRRDHGTKLEVSPATSPSTAVSFAPLHAIITALDTQARAFENGGLTKELYLLADNDAFGAWRYYTAPEAPSLGPSTIASPDNLARAGRAFESLLGSMILYSQQRAHQIASVLTEGNVDALGDLIKGQETFARGFNELSTALRHLDPSHASDGDITAENPKLNSQQQTAVLVLRLFQTTTRLLFYKDPVDDPADPFDIERLFCRIVDLADKVLHNEGSARAVTKGVFTPTPSTTSPLFLVAHSGFAESTRLRAIKLMRKYPRREGLWDSVFAADLADRILCRELSSGLSPTLAKIHDIKISFEGDRRARVTLCNWAEWQSGEAGKVSLLEW